MSDAFNLTRFEQELVRHLRALPFEKQQHVSRYILRLQKEQGTVPQDERAAVPFGQSGGPVWNMTPDELAEIRQEIREEEEREN